MAGALPHARHTDGADGEHRREIAGVTVTSLLDALCLSERLFPLAQPEPAVYYSSLAWRSQQQGYPS